MKNLILKSTLFLGATLAMGLSAQAQSIKVSVPFAFEANGKSMPAGEYSVHEVTGNAGGIYSMRNLDTRDGVLLMGNAPISYTSSETKRGVRQAPGGYYLTQVWDCSIAPALRSPPRT